MAHEDSNERTPQAGQLPAMVVGLVEVNRLKRELEAIDETLLEHTLRKQGNGAQMLKSSKLMDQLVSSNKLNLLHKSDREGLHNFLEAVADRAPVLHISFSADPPPSFLERLMTWLRQNIHPQVMVTIGIQPTIAAGCIVRSTNKHFDFSLRQDFADKRELLLTQINKQRAQEAET